VLMRLVEERRLGLEDDKTPRAGGGR
jgi:hypothetical protein